MELRAIQKNLVAQIQESGGKISLLSELNLDADELECIRRNGDLLKDNMVRGHIHRDLVCCYYLMDCGMKWYDEGNYWSHVESDNNKQVVMGRFFEDTIKKYRLAWEDVKGRKYVTMILMHALIAEGYASDFYNLIYKSYSILLQDRSIEDLSKYLDVIASVFADKDLAEKYPELKNMKLIKSSRLALSNVDYFGGTVTKIVKRISNNYESIDEVRLGIFEDSFKKWNMELKTNKNSRLKMDVGASPFILFDLERFSMNLVVPPRILKGKNGLLKVTGEDCSELYSCNLYSYNQFDVDISVEKIIPIKWNPLDEFKVVLGNDVIYNNINPGHILLSKNGKRRNRVSMGFNMVIVPEGETISLQSRTIGYGYSGYSVLGFMMMYGDSLEVQGAQYTIESEVTESIHITTQNVDVECKDDDGNKYNVYRTHPTLRIEYNLNSKKFDLGISRGFDRVVYSSIEMLELDPAFSRTSSGGVLDLSRTTLDDSDGLYKIRFKGRDFIYLLSKDFSFKFEEDEYIEDKESSVDCSLLDEPIIFRTNQGVVNINHSVDGRDLIVRLQVPSRRFSFDKKVWHLFDQDLYYRLANQDHLYIFCPTLVIPVISVDYKGARELNLEIEGRYLSCEMRRILMVGAQLEYAGILIPSIQFSCGRFRLFRMRYTANYSLSDGIVTRENSPNNTYAVASVDGSEPIPFEDDQFIVPKDSDGILEVIEIYSTGFGEDKRIAFRADVGLEFDYNPELIRSGSIKDHYEVSYHGEKYVFTGDDLAEYLSIDSIGVSNAFTSDDPNKVMVYEKTVERIKEILLKENSWNRLHRRIIHFMSSDMDLAVRLGYRYVEISDTIEARDLLEKVLEESRK